MGFWCGFLFHHFFEESLVFGNQFKVRCLIQEEGTDVVFFRSFSDQLDEFFLLGHGQLLVNRLNAFHDEAQAFVCLPAYSSGCLRFGPFRLEWVQLVDAHCFVTNTPCVSASDGLFVQQNNMVASTQFRYVQPL